jgi:hypothetical protein
LEFKKRFKKTFKFTLDTIESMLWYPSQKVEESVKKPYDRTVGYVGWAVGGVFARSFLLGLQNRPLLVSKMFP